MRYVKVFTDFAKTMEMLGDAEKGRLFAAMLEYAETGKEPDLRGNEKFVWPTAKLGIDRDAGAYERKVSAARTNGMLGGRKKTDIGFSKTKKTDVGYFGSEKTNTEQDKDKDKDKDAVARTRATAQSPLLADAEMDAASANYQQDQQAILAAMERVGMQASSYNADTALSLAATYGAQAVVAALEKAAQHDRRGGISWVFVKAILENPQQPPKPKTRKIRETLVINGELVETVREVPYDHPIR